MAAAMVASAFTAPHVTEFLTVDVTRMMKLRQRLAVGDAMGVKASGGIADGASARGLRQARMLRHAGARQQLAEAGHGIGGPGRQHLHERMLGAEQHERGAVDRVDARGEDFDPAL